MEREGMIGLQLSHELQRELRGRPYACLALEVTGGCAVLIKAPGADARSLSRPGLVIRANLAYAAMAWAPVLCLVCQIEDTPVSPWQSDTYFEVAQSWARRLVEHLGQQETLKFFILDDGLQTVGAKQITWGELQQQEAQALLGRALTDLRAIPPDRYDFARAKAAFHRRWSLSAPLGEPG